jgi:hypothetical protein
MLHSALNKLIIHKMSIGAIPPGGGFADGVKFLSNSKNISNGFKDAKEWVNVAINTIRLAADPNPWKNSTDEEIAEEILRQINERRSRKY